MNNLVKHGLGSAIAAVLLAGCNSNNSDPTPIPEPPAKLNFVTIVIDDMGYSDLGAFGGEVETPNLDMLAGEGVILSNFYAAATSSVSRSLLFSGKDNHKNGMGTMRELIERSPRPEHADQPGYQGVLSLDTLPFPEVLKDDGYHTMMTGKWHMGGDEEGEEAYYAFNRGFSATKALLLGGGDLDYMTNEDGDFITEHTKTYDDRKSLYNDNGVESDFSDLPPLTHSTNNFTDSGIAMLDDWDTNKPFYLNMSYLAPHGPLQAPKALIDKYVPTYTEGWDKIRESRFEKLKELGNVALTATLSARPSDVKAWDDLTDREKQFEARRMAIYAAEIDLLDQNIGRLIQDLKDRGVYENTVFFVYSDNGAAFQGFASVPDGVTNHGLTQVNDISDEDFQQVMDDLGGASSFIFPTAGWGHVSSTPFTGYKSYALDGGTRGAAFVHYPKAKKTGVSTDCTYSVMDIAPTILDLAGADYPTEYKGKENKPMDGISMSGIFNGDLSCDRERTLGFELNGGKAVRKGDFKIAQAPNSGNHMGLYNVTSDPFEQNDLSKELPGKYQELLGLYQQYAEESGVVEINSVYLREELADADTTTAKIRGGSSSISNGGLTNLFSAGYGTPISPTRSFTSVASISIEGEIRPEEAHVGQYGEIYVTVKNVTSGINYALTGVGFVESEGLTPYQTISELPNMVTLSIFNGSLTDSIFDTAASFEITLTYRSSDGTLIDNAAQPIRVTITE